MAAHVLRLVLSCRRFTAQVTEQTSQSIITMASSTEHEFLSQYKSKLNRFPRSRIYWDTKTSSKIGDKIAIRLREIGIDSVRIDAHEELSRPIFYRKMVAPFFDSVKRGGIIVSGAEDLVFLG